MKIYLAAKFHADGRNQVTLDAIQQSLEKEGHEVLLFIRKQWDSGAPPDPKKMMHEALAWIDAAGVLMIEASEKGVGLGIEAGYGYAKGKPIYVVAPRGTEISETLLGIATKVVFYERPSEVGVLFDEL